MPDSEDISSNPMAKNKTQVIGELIETRLKRRTVVLGIMAATGAVTAGCRGFDDHFEGCFQFPEIARGVDGNHHVPNGYRADVLLSWGDHLFDDNAPSFDPYKQTEFEQLKRFGYNNDYVGFVPFFANPFRGLLCVNHEYTNTRLMFPGVAAGFPASITKEHVLVEMAAQGGSVIEIKKEAGRWLPVLGSLYNRRITAHKTPMRLTGPAAGDVRLKTLDDPSGTIVAGTMSNCAGGITPWGTWLMAEENFHLYFMGQLPNGHLEASNHARYGLSKPLVSWGLYESRFNLENEPREPNRFGWVVEVDPKDPSSIPKKRTALGRIMHEGAESVVAPDGRVVLYMGDDQRFEYVYKFVTAYQYQEDVTNPDLLDEGTLYVARFDTSGYVDWLPLKFGEGPLIPGNGFNSQADVLIETRRAADLLNATPMDRPEDVEPDAATGRVWVMLTNNDKRTKDQLDPANPRANNSAGHIIEIIEPGGDFTATRSRWEVLVLCGNPADGNAQASWNRATSEHGWFGSPDNAVVDPMGRLWVATDGNADTGAADGVWAVETDGARRGTGRAFFRAPVGAEVCGPMFTPDGKTLFVSVQHPGDGAEATFESPTCRWPDFRDDMPPRPSVLAISQDNGNPIG